MNPQNKWLKWTGIVLNVAVAGMMIFAGSFKLFGSIPAEDMEKMQQSGLADKLQIIACGEIIAALLLLIPWTAPLGTLVTSGFWGGVICFHFTSDGQIMPGSMFLVLTWIGSYLRGSVPLCWCESKAAAANSAGG